MAEFPNHFRLGPQRIRILSKESKEYRDVTVIKDDEKYWSGYYTRDQSKLPVTWPKNLWQKVEAYTCMYCNVYDEVYRAIDNRAKHAHCCESCWQKLPEKEAIAFKRVVVDHYYPDDNG